MSEAAAPSPFAPHLPWTAGSGPVQPTAARRLRLAEPRANPPAGRNLLLRLVALAMEARERQVEREIGRLVECRGGKFTNEVERRVEEFLVDRERC